AGEDTSTQEGVSGALKDTAVKDVADNVVKGTEAIKDAVPSPATIAPPFLLKIPCVLIP
ncbi:hypothetical protein A2U01_0096938, partial [Trifolium medium]|nr:hypothetical protein [Trifolium medium]